MYGKVSPMYTSKHLATIQRYNKRQWRTLVNLVLQMRDITKYAMTNIFVHI
jgi:hypothetical protein